MSELKHRKIVPTAKETDLLDRVKRIESFQAKLDSFLFVVAFLFIFFGTIIGIWTIGHRDGYIDGVEAYIKYEQCTIKVLDKDLNKTGECWDKYMYK